MSGIKLWGFSGSTYVRTVRIVLAEKGVSDYEQEPINVLEGDPQSPEHRERHPFSKVPVLDHDGTRLYETTAICQYLDTVLPGRSVYPADAKARAKVDMTTSIIDSYGYGAIIGGVVAYHLFPEFVGGRDDEAHKKALETTRLVIGEIMDLKGGDPFIAGMDHSVADYYLAPLVFYLTLTPHKEEILGLSGVSDWWRRVSDLKSVAATEPQM